MPRRRHTAARQTRQPPFALTLVVSGLVFVVLAAACGPAGAVGRPASTAPPACPATFPNGNAPPNERPGTNYDANGKLWTILPPDGTVLVTDPGWIEPDGRIGLKWQWWRSAASAGQLTITGRRVDAEAPPLEAVIPEGYGTTGHQTSGIIFPTPGCWEVRGARAAWS